MKWLRVFVLTAAMVSPVADAQVVPRPAPRTELMIVTGSESGIYYQMARDVKRLLTEAAPEANVDLAVVPSQGALQNVIDVFRHPSIHLGVTQGDVLSYLEIYARGDPEARRAVGGLQVIGGLYDEEVYLFARPGIKSIADLTGKRVDIGPPGSGTTVTSLVLLHLFGAEPREIVNFFEVGDTISALRKGRIDAFFRVIATPAGYLRDAISASHGFVLVPIRLAPTPGNEALAQHYLPSVIPAKAYPWLDHDVDTVKVDTAIVTAGVPPDSPECDAIGRLIKAVRENRAWLRTHGHARWKDTGHDAAAILAHPRVSPCAVKALRQ
jgi:TRAP transporter TAXI family solute receptor